VGYVIGRALETKGLRQLLSGKTAKVFDCDGGYLPLTSHGLSLSSRGFLGQASPPRALTEIRASHLHARSNLSQLWQAKWKIDKVSVAHLQAAYGDLAAQQINRKDFPPPELFPPLLKESPLDLDLRDVDIRYTDLFWGTAPEAAGEFRDVHTNFYPRDKKLIVHGEGGTFRQAKWPTAQVQEIKLFYDKPELRIDEALLTFGGQSVISVLGSARFEQQQSFNFDLAVAHCPLAPFLSPEQRAKIEGELDATARIQKDQSQPESARSVGSITLTRVILKNIDTLKRAADFTGHKELAPMKLDGVRGTYDWNSPTLTVKDFVLESRQVARLQGQFSVQEQKINGEFELGVAPDIVDKFPGAREEVFKRSAGGYLWTELTVGGTLTNPHDNLKGRLVRAAQNHFSKGLLAPIFKPGQTIIEAIQEL
jgi:hypothetical protein